MSANTLKQEALASLRMITIGNEVNVFDDASEKEVFANAHSAMNRKGALVKWEDGSKQFIHHNVITENGEQIWSRDGEKVLHETVLHTNHPNGDKSEEVVRCSFRTWD